MTNGTRYDAKLARHEAAHFVIHWATDCIAPYVTIRPEERKRSRDGNYEILGRTFGCDGCPTPYEHILIALAGPFADCWKNENAEIFEIEKARIEAALSLLAQGQSPSPDDAGDWDDILRSLAQFGVDVLNPAQLKDALSLFFDAVRSILKLCKREWKDATQHLIEHGRIGYDGDRPDLGQGAEAFFCKWCDADGEVPKAVKICIARFRVAASEKATAKG